MSETFKAVLLEQGEEKVSASVTDVDVDALPEGDVTVAVEYRPSTTRTAWS